MNAQQLLQRLFEGSGESEVVSADKKCPVTWCELT
jgi:hypothetical protein